MDRAFEILEDIVAHLVAGDAKDLLVGQLEGGVEAAPENDAGNEATQYERPETEHRAGPPQYAPEFPAKVVKPAPERGPLGARGVGHFRRSPAVARSRTVSTSTNVFCTGAFTTCCGTWHCSQK